VHFSLIHSHGAKCVRLKHVKWLHFSEKWGKCRSEKICWDIRYCADVTAAVGEDAFEFCRTRRLSAATCEQSWQLSVYYVTYKMSTRCWINQPRVAPKTGNSIAVHAQKCWAYLKSMSNPNSRVEMDLNPYHNLKSQILSDLEVSNLFIQILKQVPNPKFSKCTIF